VSTNSEIHYFSFVLSLYGRTEETLCVSTNSEIHSRIKQKAQETRRGQLSDRDFPLGWNRMRLVADRLASYDKFCVIHFPLFIAEVVELLL